MLLLSPDQVTRFEGMKEDHKLRYGYSYLSPSSLNDFKDCSHKFKLRSQFRSVGLTTIAGNIIHAFVKDIADAISKFMSSDGQSLDEAIKSVVSSVDLSDSFKKCVAQHTDMLTIKIQTKELLVRDKDRAVLVSNKSISDRLFETVEGLIANEAFIRKVITVPPVASETPGYFVFNDDHIVYGVLDYVGIDDDYLYLIDYKSVWGSRSRNEWDKVTSTLQLWMYNQILTSAITEGVLPNKKVKTLVRLIYIELPQKYERIDFSKLTVEVITKEIILTENDIARYFSDLMSTTLLLEKGCGYIANSKYGCDSCIYNTECVYYLTKETADEEASV